MQIVHAPHLTVREAWLALREEAALEPALPIVDAHHHLWDRQTGRYLADEFGKDVASGHRIVSTVYVQCRSMLRRDGPEPMKPLGEVEFANGVAAMFASGAYGPTRVCQAIVGGADLTLGWDLEGVLEAMLQVSGAGCAGFAIRSRGTRVLRSVPVPSRRRATSWKTRRFSRACEPSRSTACRSMPGFITRNSISCMRWR